MSRDGALRITFRQKLPTAMWVSVETGLTEGGVPDAHYLFPCGIAGWIESKKTAANAVKFRTLQIAWLSRYWRLGGRCFIAVRQTKRDELYLFRGADVIAVRDHGLVGAEPLGMWQGGKAKWDWVAVREILTREYPRQA